MIGRKTATRLRDPGCCFLRVINDLINLGLLFAELSVDWKCPGDIGRVMAVFGAHVHQEKLSLLHRILDLLVMQRSRVWATPDNIGIAPVVGVAQLERIGYLRIDFVFPLDRKSTRLNSSHLGISYAVFCLKKKK